MKACDELLPRDLPKEVEFNNDGMRPLSVPGFPDTYIDAKLHWQEAWPQDGAISENYRVTARETAMLQLMEHITDEEDWAEKVFSEVDVKFWQKEALQRPLINEATWQWCVAELRDKAKAYRSTKQHLTLNTYFGVCKSDIAISDDQREKLSRLIPACSMLSKGSEPLSHQIDPALYPLVFDRTPVLQGADRVQLEDFMQHVGQGHTIPALAFDGEHRTPDDTWSSPSLKSQWLPFEVEFAQDPQDTKAARITSYINNVHPKDQRPLYDTIEDILPSAMKMWNQVLQGQGKPCYPRRIKSWGVAWSERPWKDLPWLRDPKLLSFKNPELLASATEYMKAYLAQPEPLTEGLSHALRPRAPGLFPPPPGPPRSPEVLNQYQFEPAPPSKAYPEQLPRIIYSKWVRLRTWRHPDPGETFTYEQWKCGNTANGMEVISDRPAFLYPVLDRGNHEYNTMDIEEQFQEKEIQVIAKASSIDLAPSPDSSGVLYDRDEWSVEGVINERIIGVARIYYSVENVTKPVLQFRQALQLSQYTYTDGRGNAVAAYNETYGIEVGDTSAARLTNDEEGDMIAEGPGLCYWERMDLGSITVRSGRMLAWSNGLETRLKPVSLLNSNQPGHVRWLSLFLVDPHYRIVSTRNVPPQQADWWLRDALEAAELERWLPPELINLIVDEIKAWPMSPEEAMEHKITMDSERACVLQDR